VNPQKPGDALPRVVKLLLTRSTPAPAYTELVLDLAGAVSFHHSLHSAYHDTVISADTRTDDTLALGSALLQLLHNGVLPSSTEIPNVLPLLDPLFSTSMPESWVRGAILIRMNSLIRGQSGVRWELIERMGELLHANITPLVPLRGSISASGGML
jgi:hypothetical protein